MSHKRLGNLKVYGWHSQPLDLILEAFMKYSGSPGRLR